jgi:hypothetical protein
MNTVARGLAMPFIKTDQLSHVSEPARARGAHKKTRGLTAG